LGGDIKENWGSVGQSPPVGSRGGALVGESGGQSPPEAEAFFVKLHIIALKYNKQQLLLLLDKINLA